MTPVPPKVSIVTSSFNQGEFIGRTIESIRTQDYADIEHIVVDGMSSDSTVAVLERYPHLKVIREPDRGQADAINKGFRVATGDIFAFVNSDDTLAPGAVAAAVAAVDAARGRHIVFGRCRFIDEHDRFLGVEHPSAFESHRRVLEIWKGHCLPQPSVFWTRGVWERSGPLNVNEQLMLDYDLFCRFSRDYDFHHVDRVLSNYRLHTQSKTTGVTDADRLEQAIVVSRRYWGSPLNPASWPIRASYLRFRLDRRARAVQLMRAGRARLRLGQRISGAGLIASGAVLAPDVVSDVALMPALRPILRKALGRRLPFRRRRAVPPQTQAYLSGTALHADNWAGPTVVVTQVAEAPPTALVLEAEMPPGALERPLTIEAAVNGRSLGVRPAGNGPTFRVVWSSKGVPAGSCEIHLKANGFIVPHHFLGTHDYRPLSYHVRSLTLSADAAET